MAVHTLPLRTDLPHYEFQMTLDERAYTFELRWSTRESAWYLSLSTEEGDPIFGAYKVVLGHNIGVRSPHAANLPGYLIAFDTSGRDLAPGINDLGARVKMLYFDESELTPW